MQNKNLKTISLSEMNTTESMALTYDDVFMRIQTGEWSLEHFTTWIEDKVNYSFGDGYGDGYEVAERISRYYDVYVHMN